MLDLIREKIKTAQDKDVEDKKGTQPKRYYAADADGDKMSKKTKEKRATHFAKNSKKDDDDGSAYKKAPGDAKADTKPSQYTKQYKKMFGEEQYTDLEEGKLVGNTGFIIDTLVGMVKKEVGKEMQKSREKGVVLMNKLARMIGASVSISHKRPKSDLFIKSSYAFVNDGEPIVQGDDVEEERNYKKEYENYQGKPEQIKRRAARNAARLSLKDNKDIEGKDVHHKDNNPLNNDKKNLSVVTKKFNRTEPRKR